LEVPGRRVPQAHRFIKEVFASSHCELGADSSTGAVAGLMQRRWHYSLPEGRSCAPGVCRVPPNRPGRMYAPVSNGADRTELQGGPTRGFSRQ